MPQPYDYSTVQVNPDNYFESVRQGRAEQAQQEAATRQSALQKYMPGALNGDKTATEQAFANATPDQAMQLKQALMKMEDRDLQKNLEQQDKFARLAQWADTPQKWAQATQMAEAEGMRGASQVPFEQREAKLAGMISVKDQLAQEWKRREFELQTRDTNASIAAKNAQADAARRRAASPGGVGGVSIDPETGALIASSGLSNMKLTEGQSKDIAFLNRANAANNKLDADRTAALVSSKNLGRNVPLIGNALQSSSSRQGGQIGKDFIAAVLRKDTGAAVTEQEFSFYSDIFLPQWGDDEASLKLKEQSRKSFLDGMRSGLSNGAALARMGVIPPPELAVPGATETPPPASGKPSAVPPPPPGFVVK